jgi:glyoxylase-like metal-dependent hydrolase (beta-lactamase superfamily II)
VFSLAATTIQKIHEMDLNGFTLPQLLPAVDDHLRQRHPEWFPTGTIDEAHALLSVHSWLVRHEGKVILIDTGAGNDKARPQQLVLNHLSNPFLDRLADAGVTPEMVDYVIHTHIHSDHVGWNTRLADGEWRPTFPNAVTICSRLEWEYGAALAEGNEKAIAEAREKAGLGDPIRIPVSGTFNDSMRPLLASGRVRLVDVHVEEEILPGIRFLPTPGHSIDHAAIELTVDEGTAIFGGDVAHHPLEFYDTGLVSIFCEFPEAARRSRRALLERAVERKALYFGAHFPLSSAGKINKKKGAYVWNFLEVGDS